MKDNYLKREDFQELYKDFLHPNPNINDQAIYKLKERFPIEFKRNLFDNLKNEDVTIRRKSILALGVYGDQTFKELVKLYLYTTNKIIKVSCLKAVIKGFVFSDLKNVSGDINLSLKLADSGELKASSVSGDMAFTFGAIPNASFDITTNAGGDIVNRISNDKPTESRWGTSSELNFEVGTGSARVGLTTVSGTVEIRRD